MENTIFAVTFRAARVAEPYGGRYLKRRWTTEVASVIRKANRVKRLGGGVYDGLPLSGGTT